MKTLKELLINQVLQENASSEDNSILEKVGELVPDKHYEIIKNNPIGTNIWAIKSIEAVAKIAEENELGPKVDIRRIEKGRFNPDTTGYDCYCLWNGEKKVFIAFCDYHRTYFLYGEDVMDFELSFKYLPKDIQNFISQETFEKLYERFSQKLIEYDVGEEFKKDIDYKILYTENGDYFYLLQILSPKLALYLIEKDDYKPLDSINGLPLPKENIVNLIKKDWNKYNFFYCNSREIQCIFQTGYEDGVYERRIFHSGYFDYPLYTHSKCYPEVYKMEMIAKSAT